jgi:hypothetical protein
MSIKAQWITCFLAAAVLVGALGSYGRFDLTGYLISVFVLGFILAAVFGNPDTGE